MENAVTYLLTWGASPNAQDKEFALTPLHLGALSGNPRIVRRLLSNGANKNKRVKKNIYGFWSNEIIKTKEGKLPIDIAIENEYDDIVQILVFYFLVYKLKFSYSKIKIGSCLFWT